jgi:ATP-dependent DNA ligase
LRDLNVTPHIAQNTTNRSSAIDVRTTRRVPPGIPTRAPKPPTGPGWVHEIKHDGYRLQLRREGGVVRLFTRRGYEWNGRYPAIRPGPLVSLGCQRTQGTFSPRNAVGGGDAVLAQGTVEEEQDGRASVTRLAGEQTL